ncbi:MAG: hypothetical protein JNM80_02530 [Phycisphaerae bacterium]|nr:hypothetical protein [Phycisphaerae bacterium]
MRPLAALLLSASVALLAACSRDATTPRTDASAHAARPSEPTVGPTDPARRNAYYLSTCALCNRPLGYIGPAIDHTHAGRPLRFCATSCVDRFLADPAAGLAHADAVMIADQRPHYPPGPSIVSGRALGPAPVEIIWNNRLVRLADDDDRRAFLADPDRHLRALDDAVLAAQAPTYGMPTRCPVQGDILDDDVPIDIVIASRMVRVCCQRCVRVVRARPYQYLAMVDYANKEAAQRAAK